DGVGHRLDEFNILVADTEGALSIGGIMGGLESEVRDGTEDVLDATGIALSEDEEREDILRGKASARGPVTQNVLLEAAAWNFINIRRTMQSQKITSEAGMRF